MASVLVFLTTAGPKPVPYMNYICFEQTLFSIKFAEQIFNQFLCVWRPLFDIVIFNHSGDISILSQVCYCWPCISDLNLETYGLTLNRLDPVIYLYEFPWKASWSIESRSNWFWSSGFVTSQWSWFVTLVYELLKIQVLLTIIWHLFSVEK